MFLNFHYNQAKKLKIVILNFFFTILTNSEQLKNFFYTLSTNSSNISNKLELFV